MSSTMTAMYHTQKGARFLKIEQWGEAATEFSRAIWASGPRPIPEALNGRACAVLQSDATIDETLAAFAEARVHGFDDPRFWALSIRYYLVTFDQNRDRAHMLSRNGRAYLNTLERDALADIQFGIDRFQTFIMGGKQEAYLWGAALVGLADWLYEFSNTSKADWDGAKYPFREFADNLYRPVASVDLARLFTDRDLQQEIECDVTGRARRQLLHAESAAGETRDRASEYLPWWTYAVVGIAAFVLLSIQWWLVVLCLVPFALLLVSGARPL